MSSAPRARARTVPPPRTPRGRAATLPAGAPDRSPHARRGARKMRQLPPFMLGRGPGSLSRSARRAPGSVGVPVPYLCRACAYWLLAVGRSACRKFCRTSRPTRRVARARALPLMSAQSSFAPLGGRRSAAPALAKSATPDVTASAVAVQISAVPARRTLASKTNPPQPKSAPPGRHGPTARRRRKMATSCVAVLTLPDQPTAVAARTPRAPAHLQTRGRRVGGGRRRRRAQRQRQRRTLAGRRRRSRGRG